MKIQLATTLELSSIFKIFKDCKKALDAKDIPQWTDTYPNVEILERDIKSRETYVLLDKNELIGTVTINEQQDQQYTDIDWKFDNTKVLVIHRLAIAPSLQGNGYARKLMDFAEDYAIKNSYTAIRLDAFAPHERIIQFYLKRNYKIRGETFFPGRSQPFYCMEKAI